MYMSSVRKTCACANAYLYVYHICTHVVCIHILCTHMYMSSIMELPMYTSSIMEHMYTSSITYTYFLWKNMMELVYIFLMEKRKTCECALAHSHVYHTCTQIVCVHISYMHTCMKYTFTYTLKYACAFYVYKKYLCMHTYIQKIFTYAYVYELHTHVYTQVCMRTHLMYTYIKYLCTRM